MLLACGISVPQSPPVRFLERPVRLLIAVNYDWLINEDVAGRLRRPACRPGTHNFGDERETIHGPTLTPIPQLGNGLKAYFSARNLSQNK
jgi:hypothetical protein